MGIRFLDFLCVLNTFFEFPTVEIRFLKLVFVRTSVFETPTCQWSCTCMCECLCKCYVDAYAYSYVYVYVETFMSKGNRFLKLPSGVCLRAYVHVNKYV